MIYEYSQQTGFKYKCKWLAMANSWVFYVGLNLDRLKSFTIHKSSIYNHYEREVGLASLLATSSSSFHQWIIHAFQLKESVRFPYKNEYNLVHRGDKNPVVNRAPFVDLKYQNKFKPIIIEIQT